eukprot:Blabericola_migrator_1__3150@NODE_191_length_11624_cov_142_842866_g68_i1_p10_GENE_NODE_191_length_11624_cov_142_842866_g68_i1NODE_191_length_11624_cov_142_842866_g68_i1_p10_ORF_typecomplete_len115_score8_60ROQ_II/PF18386_1/0_016_NODE_191_length_11624_cov_142_842866_g68_i196499993
MVLDCIRLSMPMSTIIDFVHTLDTTRPDTLYSASYSHFVGARRRQRSNASEFVTERQLKIVHDASLVRIVTESGSRGSVSRVPGKVNTMSKPSPSISSSSIVTPSAQAVLSIML